MENIRFFILALLLFPTTVSYTQSCCSGGVPLSSNLGLPSVDPGVMQLSLSYDYNNLNTLKAGWEKLDDDTRERITHSALLNWGVAVNNRISVEGIFSYLSQVRKVTLTSTDITQTNGIGDAVFLINYRLWTAKNKASNWRAALGVKAPLGATDRKDDRGIRVSEELQPGSGAWDAIVWTQFSHNLKVRPSTTINLTSAYSYKGKTSGEQPYQFGNEWQFSFGIADRWLLGKALFDPGLSIRYRWAGADEFDSAPLPATGGQWVFIQPNLSWWLQPDLSFSLSATVPVLAYVENTQFSPTLRTNVGIFYRFALWKKPVQPYTLTNNNN